MATMTETRSAWDKAKADGCYVCSDTMRGPSYEWECDWCLAGPSKGHVSVAAAHAHYLATHLPKCPRRTPTTGERDDRPKLEPAYDGYGPCDCCGAEAALLDDPHAGAMVCATCDAEAVALEGADAEDDEPAHVVAIRTDAVDGYRAECGCGWARVWAETDPLQRLADAHAAKGVEDDCSELDGYWLKMAAAGELRRMAN